MMKRSPIRYVTQSALALIAGLLLSGAMSVAAPSLALADAPPSRQALSGVYLNLVADHGSAAIEAGVDTALSEAGRVIRGIARPRLLKNNPPVRRLEIRLSEGEASVAYDDFRSYRGPLGGGSPRSQDAPEGGKVKVHYVWEGDSLIEIAEAGEGSARIKYTRDGARLRVETSIESRFLPAPIRFTMYFRAA